MKTDKPSNLRSTIQSILDSIPESYYLNNPLDINSDIVDSSINSIELSIPLSSSSQSINSLSLSHYVTHISDSNIEDNTVIIEDIEDNEEIAIDTLPLFLESPTTIKIPNKLMRTLRYVPVGLMKEIHEDYETAIELCLIFLSNLSDTHFTMRDATNKKEEEGWKKLSATLLHKQTSNSKTNYRYINIIKALTFGTKNKGAIIERDIQTGYKAKKINGISQSYFYRLTDTFRGKGVVTYTLTTEVAQKLTKKVYFEMKAQAESNTIAKNLLMTYHKIELPTLEEINQEAKRLVKEKFVTKKGKKFVFRNKHADSYFSDVKKLSFVEDNIELYENLTSGGFMIPTVGGERAGGRVTDSFTLMPSWIRKLVKINGTRIKEVDYSALHPNIAMKLYGGTSEYITHTKVAEDACIDVNMVKIEHLSFFNKEWRQICTSPLFSYYTQKEPKMMENLFHDKDDNGYRMTSQRMFGVEVAIMTEVIERLNTMDIYVGYIYDALFCEQGEENTVNQVMNDVILEHGVLTKAK